MKVGIDIIELDRVEDSKKFMERIFTPKELAYINKFSAKKERIAGHFCAKEAIFKALDLFFINYQEIEIIHSQTGRPMVNFYGKTREFFAENFKDIDISISHSKTVATAICIAEEKSKIVFI